MTFDEFLKFIRLGENPRGSYDTLFNNSQMPGMPFEGTNVSQMTLDELYKFSDPSGAYGQYVKGINPEGRVATPMGFFQIVGRTLRDFAKRLNLPGDTVFSKDVQDKLGRAIYESQGQAAFPGAVKAMNKASAANQGPKPLTAPGLFNFMEPSEMQPNNQTQARGGLLQSIFGGGAPRTLEDEQARLRRLQFAQSLNALIMPELRMDMQDQIDSQRDIVDRNRTVDVLKARAAAGDPIAQQILEAVTAGSINPREAMTTLLNYNIGQATADTKNVMGAEELRKLYPGTEIADGLYNVIKSPQGGIKISKVGGAGTNINMPGDNNPEDKLIEELMKAQGKDFAGFLVAGSAASQALRDLNVLQQLAPLAPSGPITGALAQAFPLFDDVAALRQSIVLRVAPTLRVEGSGATSDLEFNAMVNSLGSLQNSKEANQAILSVMIAKQRYNLERANIVRQYQTNDKFTLQDANDAIAALEQDSTIPVQVRDLLNKYGSNTSQPSQLPIRTWNPETGSFE
jgi:hypothetical protein